MSGLPLRKITQVIKLYGRGNIGADKLIKQIGTADRMTFLQILTDIIGKYV